MSDFITTESLDPGSIFDPVADTAAGAVEIGFQRSAHRNCSDKVLARWGIDSEAVTEAKTNPPGLPKP